MIHSIGGLVKHSAWEPEPGASNLAHGMALENVTNAKKEGTNLHI